MSSIVDHLAVTKLAAETQTGSEPYQCCNAPIMNQNCSADRLDRSSLYPFALCLMSFHLAPCNCCLHQYFLFNVSNRLGINRSVEADFKFLNLAAALMFGRGCKSKRERGEKRLYPKFICQIQFKFPLS